MHQTLKRAVARRAVLADHRSGFGGQLLLASVSVDLAEVTQLQRAGLLSPNTAAELYRDTCRDRRKLRRQIRTHKLGQAAL